MNLTIAFITSRKEPKIEWFFHSLWHQLHQDWPSIIVVNQSLDKSYRVARRLLGDEIINFDHVPPKPTIWQGEHRITKEDWWAKSNALNTAIILCKTEWISFVDDRCVLSPQWLQCVQEAMTGGYAVCGSYEKRANLKVENGEIVDQGELLGADTRRIGFYPFDSWYGGSGVLPLEWCLKVNGFPEDMCDGLGSEDSMFGTMLLNAGYPIFYNSQMRIIEDRTPGESYEGALKRADKNSHLGQKAKSWDIVRCFRDKTTSGNSYDIRQHKARVQNGEDLNSILPSASHYDWYDNSYIGDMT